DHPLDVGRAVGLHHLDRLALVGGHRRPTSRVQALAPGDERRITARTLGPLRTSEPLHFESNCLANSHPAKHGKLNFPRTTMLANLFVELLKKYSRPRSARLSNSLSYFCAPAAS